MHSKSTNIETHLVFICIPSRDLWKAEFGINLAQMVGRCFVDHGAPSYGFRVFAYPTMASGSTLSTNRNVLVERALQNEDTSHVLFVDDDQMFPADTIHKLIQRDKDIIGANIVRKESNPRTNSRKLGGKDECCWTKETSTGIEEVEYVGTGLMLIKRAVFEKMPKPWFFYDAHKAVGEDVCFCWKARELGYKIYVDHDLSKSVKHVGHFYWGHEHTGGYK